MIPSTRLTEFPLILSDLGPLHAVPEVLGDHANALTHAVGVYNPVRDAVLDCVSGGAESGAGHNDKYGQCLTEAYADVLAKWREWALRCSRNSHPCGTSSVADCHAAHLDLMTLLDALRSPDAIHAPARETLRFWQQVDLKLPVALHAEATGRVSSLTGSTLLVLAVARDDGPEPDGPPWLLTPAEIEAFVADGLTSRSIRRDNGRWWVAEFVRQLALN